MVGSGGCPRPNDWVLRCNVQNNYKWVLLHGSGVGVAVLLVSLGHWSSGPQRAHSF